MNLSPEPRKRAAGRVLVVLFCIGISLVAVISARRADTLIASAQDYVGAFCIFAPGLRGERTLAEASSRPPGAVATLQTADLVLTNGVIYTLDPERSRAEALAVAGDKIVGVGTSEEIRTWVGPRTRVVDLKGRFAMPGFNDAHVHLANGGQAKLEVNLEGARSVAEMQQRIRARLNDYQPGEWIVGRGWDHTLWPEKRFPTRQDLDAVSKDHPMFITRISGHVAVANSRALELAGISRAMKDPAGGEIERDAAGEPTGTLKETATALVGRQLPPPTPAQRRHGIELALADAARSGITSIQDNSPWEDFLVYEDIRKEGKLTSRISEWLPFTASLDRLEEMRRHGGTTDPWLKTGALKGVVDGALGSSTAALLAPYWDQPSTSGILILEPEPLKQMAIERDRAGFQIALHAIGDRANRVALDAFGAARAANGTRDRRGRIEHAQVVTRDDFARFASLNVIASMQPCHETTDMRWAEARLGPERSKGAYAWHTMLRNGVRLAFGTDYPVEPLNPMRGLYACVTRERPEGGPLGGWMPQEKISIDDCIRGYTLGSAYAEFEEDRKGQILPGKLADVVVLSADVTKISPPQLLKTEVRMTIVDGRIVYESK